REVPAIATALRTAIHDDAWHARFVALGRARAALFTWEAAARKTLEVYRAVATE
ncbi:MAG: glycosyltransferase family 1 protein, partial [Planctomycetes bacterium]|nr:glycosyltransferase family 1 protein [Planctomycetota bacterium]